MAAPPLDDLFSVQGKVALVTGASSGIGRQIARSLAYHGCHVVVAARRKGRLVDLCLEIAAFAPLQSERGRVVGRAIAVELDVGGTESQVDAAVGKAWEAFGGLDIVVNNAGVRGRKADVLEISEEEWDQTFDVNVKGVWLVTNAASRRMVASQRRRCSIINMASISGIEAGLLAGAAAYSAAKAAVIRLTKATAIELGAHGIRCNAIAPGLFESEITQDLMKKPFMGKNAERIVPLQRWGSSDPDLTSLVIYLASNSSSYMTGTCTVVDGGQSLLRLRIQSNL